MLRWKKVYDRATVLDKADRARGRGSVRKAIRGYSTILQHDPTDHQAHARVAPLYAKTRRWDDARKSFDAAAVHTAMALSANPCLRKPSSAASKLLRESSQRRVFA